MAFALRVQHLLTPVWEQWPFPKPRRRRRRNPLKRANNKDQENKKRLKKEEFAYVGQRLRRELSGKRKDMQKSLAEYYAEAENEPKLAAIRTELEAAFQQKADEPRRPHRQNKVVQKEAKKTTWINSWKQNSISGT